MSSPPSSSWPAWRRIMMIGAIILLANALAEALMEPDPPRPVKVIATAIGFVLLAVGFSQRMRAGR